MFGTDVVIIPSCYEHSFGFYCGSQPLNNGFFNLRFANNTYTALTYYQTEDGDDEVHNIFTAGKCSKI